MFRYRGAVYNRPVSRGCCLVQDGKLSGKYLEDCLPEDGFYEVEFVVYRKLTEAEVKAIEAASD